MSLHRGNYGLEYDRRYGSHTPWIWGALLLITLIVLWLVVGRGCRRSTPDKTRQLDDGIGVPEVAVKRERPSLWQHLLRRTAAEEGTGAGSRADAGAGEGKELSSRESRRSRRLAAERTARESGVEPEVAARVSQAHQAVAEGRLGDARKLYRELLVEDGAQPMRPALERALGELNRRILFEDIAAPEKGRHLVVRGDLISRLAVRYGCTQEYLLQANQLARPEALRLGQEIQVLNQPRFELTLILSARSAYLTLNGLFFKRYTFTPGSREGGVDTTTAYTLRERRITNGSETGGRGIPALVLQPANSNREALPYVLGGSWGAPQRVQGIDTFTVNFSDTDIRELHTLLPGGTVVTILE